MTQVDRHTPYFDARRLPPSQPAYVTWLDLMGTRATMSRSLPVVANFVFKLHAACLDYSNDALALYPVMDGVYVVAQDQAALKGFLRSVLGALANLFLSTPERHHRFVPKAAVAFGPVIHGRDVPRESSFTLDQHPDYRASILLGLPMIQAYEGERQAPPFGVFVHESARAFAPPATPPFHCVWWPWYGSEPGLSIKLLEGLNEYYASCEAHSLAIQYEADRITQHRKQAEQYFSTEAI